MTEIKTATVKFIEVNEVAGISLIFKGCRGIEGFNRKPGNSGLGLLLCSYGGFCRIAKINDFHVYSPSDVREICPAKIKPEAFDEIIKKTSGQITTYEGVPVQKL